MNYAKPRGGEYEFTGYICRAKRNTPKGRLVEITAVGYRSAVICELNARTLPLGLLESLEKGWLRMFVDADGKPTRAYISGRKVFPRRKGSRRLDAFVTVTKWYIEYKAQSSLPGFSTPWR